MELDQVKEHILAMRNKMPVQRAMLTGISGIDAAGKGYIASQLANRLSGELKVAVINADGWLDLPSVRFAGPDPALSFYGNGFRFDEMFDELVIPLRNTRKVDLVADHLAETAISFIPYHYTFDDIDVILLEGIFLFRPAYVDRFDLRIWIECTSDKALERAIERSQEGLESEETIRAYERIYFPAQALHFNLDRPKDAADIVVDNN
jgi:uridine kinase